MENIKHNTKEEISKFADLEKEADKYLFSDWNKCKELMRPINEWTLSIRNEVMKINPKLKSCSDVKSFLVWQDSQLARLISNPDNLSKDKIKKKEDELMTIFEDDEYKIKSIIDYDCGTTIWKMFITYKPLNFNYRDSFDIGNW